MLSIVCFRLSLLLVFPVSKGGSLGYWFQIFLSNLNVDISNYKCLWPTGFLEVSCLLFTYVWISQISSCYWFLISIHCVQNNILCIVSIILNLLRLGLWTSMWSLRKHFMCQGCLLVRTFNAALLKNVFCSSEYYYFIVVLIYVFLLNNDIEYLFMCLWAICIYSFMKCLFKFLPILSKKMCCYYQIIWIFCILDIILLLNIYVLQSFIFPIL